MAEDLNPRPRPAARWRRERDYRNGNGDRNGNTHVSSRTLSWSMIASAVAVLSASYGIIQVDKAQTLEPFRVAIANIDRRLDAIDRHLEATDRKVDMLVESDDFADELNELRRRIVELNSRMATKVDNSTRLEMREELRDADRSLAQRVFRLEQLQRQSLDDYEPELPVQRTYPQPP